MVVSWRFLTPFACIAFGSWSAALLGSPAALAQGFGGSPAGGVERRLQDEQQRERLERLQDQLRQRQPPLIEGRPDVDTDAEEPVDEPTDGVPAIEVIELEGAALPAFKAWPSVRQRFLGLPATPANLAQLRDEVSRALAQADLLAEVGQPVLQLDGLVQVPVVVARLGAVHVAENRAPIPSGWAIATVLDAVGRGREMRLDKLESALLKLNDLGGVQASARLEPGEQPGRTDVWLTLASTRQVLGEVAINNHTTKYTGPYQPQAVLELNGLFGRGEQIQVNGTYSGDPFTWGSRSSGLLLEVPLTPGGLSGVGSVNWSDYRLLDEFQSDDYTGSFYGGSLGLRQVLWRRPTRNLYGQVIADAYRLQDSVLGFEYSDRTSWAGRFSLEGDYQDSWMGVGLNSGILTLSLGTLSLDGALDRPDLADKAGPWGKLNLLLSRFQVFPGSPWSMEFFAQGQLGFSNLDSVEKMSLGWPNGVRAYPPGEAAGDSGVAVQGTVRYQIARNLTAKAFVDGGYIWRWYNPFSGSLNPNSFGLWGPGVGIEWGTRGDVLASVDVAWPIGPNRNTPEGVDVDGTNADVRVWLSLRKWL